MKNENKLEAIFVPADNNPLLKKVLNIVNENEEVRTLWEVANVNATTRLGMSDHGSIHVQIVANSSLRLSRILHKHDVTMSIEKSYGLSYDHAEVVVLLSSLLHDTGMSIHRKGHEEFSLIIANQLLSQVLDFLPTRERVIVSSEVLHSIIAHRNDGKPLTYEAGVLRVSDALDMTKGRSRVPYESENYSIYSLAETAIDNVEISEGIDKPIKVEISMNNSAGIFAVDELLKRKIIGSGLEEYISVRAYIDRENEKKLLNEFTF
ncbi:phosphohydrolase [candidate division WWE3 bacterium]|uniref:Phosphohydrolase n=1 Tax=candidate division WWE3 bacterium TaxID=2053526 RepID=A0A955RX86_UNCKA|nr:phosphohydrolase [candidate division WWE3 bacterium]